MNNVRWASDNDFTDHVVDLIQSMPEGHPMAYHQASFTTVMRAGRTTTEGLIAEHTEGWESLPVAAATLILNRVWYRAMTLGASVYASLTRSFDAPPDDSIQVGYDDVWEGAVDRRNAENEESIYFHAVLQQSGPINAVKDMMAANILSKLDHLSFVKENAGIFWEAACMNFMYGMATEASYVHCIEEKRQFNTIIVTLLSETMGADLDPDGPDFERRIRKALCALAADCPNIHPWPRDEICECGRSLKPFIFCCDPHNPIDMSAYEGQLTPEFEIKRDCCGESLPGFRCDVCGAVYTWEKGVVDSVEAN